MAFEANLRSLSIPRVIDLTTLMNAALGKMLDMDFWYFLMSLRATVPGLNLNFLFSPSAFLIPFEDGAVFLPGLPLLDWDETLEAAFFYFGILIV